MNQAIKLSMGQSSNELKDILALVMEENKANYIVTSPDKAYITKEKETTIQQ